MILKVSNDKKADLKSLKNQKSIESIKDKADHMVIIGDLNIDQWAENQPWLRPELRALQPILDRIIVNNGLKRMNHSPTRHCLNQRSSLIDLILSSDLPAIYNVKNLKVGLSDHDGIVCNISCHDSEIKPQFFVSRDFSRVNANNILPLVDSSDKLQSLFSDTDVESIASKLNDGLNEIAKSLISKKRIQKANNQRDFDDPELRHSRKRIQEKSKLAHRTGCPEEARLLKHLKNQYTKKETKKKKEFETKIMNKINAKWRFLEDDDEDKTPVCVKFDGKLTTAKEK